MQSVRERVVKCWVKNQYCAIQKVSDITGIPYHIARLHIDYYLKKSNNKLNLEVAHREQAQINLLRKQMRAMEKFGASYKDLALVFREVKHRQRKLDIVIKFDYSKGDKLVFAKEFF